MDNTIRVKIDEKEQKQIFIKFIKKFKRDFTKASNYLGISNSCLSKYKRGVIKYIPEDVLIKVTDYLKIDKPLILERGTLTDIRRNYIKKSYPILAEKYGVPWTKEIVKRRDSKGISLEDFPDYIFIYLKDEYRSRLLECAYNYAGSLNKFSKIISVSPSTLETWYKGKQKDPIRNKIGLQFMPLSKLKLISKILVEDNNHEFSMENIERNIVMYRMQAGVPIKNPKFPVKESPEMIRLLFHLLGDGYSGNKKNSANYKNTCKELLDEFKQDLKIFGEVPIYEQEYSIKFPRIIAELIENFYGVNTMTFESRISDKIKKLPKRYLYHGIRAFADDEGCLGNSRVTLYSGNRDLLEGIKGILDYIKIRRSGIRTFFNPKATSLKGYEIGIQDLELYRKKMGFIHPKKKEKLEEYVRKKKTKRRKRLLKLKS